MTVSFNPYVQTNVTGSFALESAGLVVGTMFPDPAARYQLSGGRLATTETLPMWGGVGISENIPPEAANNPRTEMGSVIARATAAANLTGFSIYDQNYSWVNSPASPVPSGDKGGQVNFARLGSLLRVILEIDPTLVSLEGGLITQQVSWDYTNQKIIAFATTALPVKILTIKSNNCMTAVYTAGPPATLTWNRNAAAAVVIL
jgi:hypothetical protein